MNAAAAAQPRVAANRPLDWLAGVRQIAGLALREAARSHLWALFALAAVAIVGVVFGASAVDRAGEIKLAVAATVAVFGFVAVLLAALVGALALRRDIEGHTGYLLFAKPLAPSAYLVGRWLGVQLALAAGLALLAVVGVLALLLRFGQLPEMRQVVSPTQWWRVTQGAEVLAIAAGKDSQSLSGPRGNALRWRFSGLHAGSPDGARELLLRLRVTGYNPEDPVEEAQVVVAVIGADGAPSPLELAPRSPYGRAGASAGRILVRSRDESRNDLAQDFLRLRLPGSAVGADGTLTIQVTRDDARGVLIAARTASCKLAEDGGGFLANLLRATLVVAAAAGLLGGWALLGATVSNLGIALLGTLTLFFAGNALPFLRELRSDDDTGHVLRRALDLALAAIPDFSRHEVAAGLAAGHGVAWGTVGAAWGYYGGYAALFLAAGWFAIRRREL